jgi:hypothetical protein
LGHKKPGDNGISPGRNLFVLKYQQILFATASPASITMPMAPLAMGFLMVSFGISKPDFAVGQMSQNFLMSAFFAGARVMSAAFWTIAFAIGFGFGMID